MERIAITLPADRYEAAAAYLSLRAPQGWQETENADGVTFTIHLEEPRLAAALARDLEARFPGCGACPEAAPDTDWALAWREFFTPIIAGGVFEVLPPWLADQGHEGLTKIIIEPKMAFGTGHHATTALCLASIGRLATGGRLRAGQRFLDLGTGSGILAIALARLGLAGLALDIDPQAVACAEENVAANACAGAVTPLAGSMEAVPEGERFELIVANILSGPLISLAPDIVPRLAPGGALILSGILVEQAAGVVAAYVALGLPEPRLEVSGEWTAIVWERA